MPIEPDQVLREMWQNPKRGYDAILVKALINLIGIYPVGTCVILDTFEVAIVAGARSRWPAAQPAAGAHRGGRRRRHRSAAGHAGAPHRAGRHRQLPALHREGHQPVALRAHRRRLLCLSRVIARTFAALRRSGRTALIPYLTAGFPDLRASEDALRVADEVADMLEVGVPFSDPLADGPTIQRSTFQALQQGMTLARHARADRPLPASATGRRLQLPQSRSCATGSIAFCATPGSLGIAGLLLTDLPAGSDPAVEDAVRRSPLDLIRLIAPTTRPERLRRGGGRGRGLRLSRRAARRHRREPRARGGSRRLGRAGARGHPAPGRRGLRHLERRSRPRQSADWPTAWWWAARWWTRSGTAAWRRRDGSCATFAAASISRRRWRKLGDVGGSSSATPGSSRSAAWSSRPAPWRTDLRWLDQPIAVICC